MIIFQGSNLTYMNRLYALYLTWWSQFEYDVKNVIKGMPNNKTSGGDILINIFKQSEFT